MNRMHQPKPEKSDVFSPISETQIEAVNLHRILMICLGTLVFEAINLINPDFWNTPILWLGAIYLSALSLIFLPILLLHKPAVLFRKPGILNALFWSLFSIGLFPFLVRDAGAGDSPLNCVLLCTVLICAPLLRVQNLRVIFLVSILVNLLAAFYAGGTALSFQYCLELVVINIMAYFLACNLHGRYFNLLDEQQRLYDQQLSDKLAQKTLQSKLEQDRMVNAARSEFLSRMSHDLRTPLNAVIGLSDIAMDESLSQEEIFSYLNDIHHSAKHLLALINDVLDVSKLEGNQMTLHPEAYSLHEFLTTVQSIVGVQCEQRGILYRTVMDDCLPAYLLVDKLRFHQIFMNLLSNAIKFTPSGGSILFQLSQGTSQEGQPTLHAVVQDTGRGMSPEFIASAFDAFAQECKEDGEHGTGLGLAIVKSIVTLMGGSLQVESRLHYGTKITVVLPLLQADPPLQEPLLQPVEESIFLHKRILLCEDHPLNQKVAVRLLTNRGMQVEIAENGAQGVSMFSQSKPWYYDAILMDVRMPVMDGLEACSAIRHLDRPDATAVPILAMTANAYEEDMEKSKAAGMNAHLNKPVEPQVLYKTLAQYLEKKRQTGDAE